MRRQARKAADDAPRAFFEDFCVVTEGVRHGIPVGVRVIDGEGQEVFATGDGPAVAEDSVEVAA